MSETATQESPVEATGLEPAPPVKPDPVPDAIKAHKPTVREVLGVKGELRPTVVQFNLNAGALVLGIEEGTRDEEGFLPTRQLGQVQVTGEDYEEFLALAKPLRKFFKDKIEKAMSQVAQVQQQG